MKRTLQCECTNRTTTESRGAVQWRVSHPVILSRPADKIEMTSASHVTENTKQASGTASPRLKYTIYMFFLLDR